MTDENDQEQEKEQEQPDPGTGTPPAGKKPGRAIGLIALLLSLTALAADGIPLGVCTNKPHEMSVLVLQALGLERFFGSVIGAGVLPVRKVKIWEQEEPGFPWMV